MKYVYRGENDDADVAGDEEESLWENSMKTPVPSLTMQFLSKLYPV